MYQLTLTKAERNTMDWIGPRYFHGDDLFDLLMDEEVAYEPDEWDWKDSEKITFTIPENIAWQIREGFESENHEFALLPPEFVQKLSGFLERIE